MSSGRFNRYTIVGILSTLIHTSIFLSLENAGTSYAVANVIAFLSASSIGFLMHAKWTFACKADWWRYIKFVGMNVLLAVISGVLGNYLYWHPVFVVIIFSCGSWILSYLSLRFIVFK